MAFEDWFVERARVTSKQHARVKPDDTMSFFQQFATLIGSGTPLLEALNIAGEQSRSTKLREVIDDVAVRVSAGTSLHVAMESHGNVFQDHWIELVRVGEVSGNIGPVMNDLVNQLRESREIRRQVVGAMIYPIVLMVVAVGVVTAMLWFVVPTFAGMFRELNTDLPAITQWVMSASDFIVSRGLYMLGGVGLAVFFCRRYMKTEAGRRRVGAMGLAAPLVGDLMVQSTMYRFSSNLALLLRSGVPMLETLSTLGAVLRSNPVYSDAILQAQSRVAAGRPLADSLEETGLFPGMLTNMVRVGEESSRLAEVMEDIAPYYRERVQAFIAKVTKLMEPSIIIVMGAIVSVLMTAIYIPMFDMAGAVK